MKALLKLFEQHNEAILIYNGLVETGKNENNFNIDELNLKLSEINYIKAQITYIELTKKKEQEQEKGKN